MSRPVLVPMWLDARSDEPAAHPVLAWAPWVLLGLIVVLGGSCFTWLSLARHLAYQSHAFDLGNMDQAVWNTAHADWLRFTDMDVHGHVLTSRLGIHVEPLLIVLAALYLIHSGPETLLVVQALVVASGAVPAYLLAREALGDRWLALVFPVAYLLHPSVQSAVLDDFHAVTLSACFLLWALTFAYRGKVGLFVVAAVFAVATKEEVALVVAMLGLLLIYRRRALAGSLTLLGGVFWFVLCLKVIIPTQNPSGQSPYLARYAYLGHGLGGVVRGIVVHPLTVMRTLASTSRLGYLGDLLFPAGFVPLLALPIFLLSTPVLLINMLSNDPTMYSGFYQYSAEIIPFVIGAAAIGAGAVVRGARALPARSAWVLPTLCFLVLAGACLDTWRDGFTPLARGYIVPSAEAHQAKEDALLRTIPSDAVVAAADEIEPHLSDRRWVYLLPTVHPRNGPGARYVVLDASIPSLPVMPSTLHAVAVSALHSGYGISRAADGILILRRGAPNHHLPDAFYTFMFGDRASVAGLDVHWGPLSLVGAVVHPRDHFVNRARPALSVETYWRVTGSIPARARIAFFMSPVYSGQRPRFSQKWMPERDSPTWDWLPVGHWPQGRIVRAVSLPLLPPPGTHGSVDLAVRVDGLGPVHGGDWVRGTRYAVRVGTVDADV